MQEALADLAGMAKKNDFEASQLFLWCVCRTKLWLALLFPLAKIGAVLVWIVRFVGCVCSEMDNASTDFRDVYAVFVFEAAADRQEEIQTEDRWWSVCWLSLQTGISTLISHQIRHANTFGIGVDENRFHEMSTFGRSEYLSVVKLPPRCDVFCPLVLRSCFLNIVSPNHAFASLDSLAIYAA